LHVQTIWSWISCSYSTTYWNFIFQSLFILLQIIIYRRLISVSLHVST
jgi:hypothetical protein